MTEVLFVHGALVRDGDWWWRPTARLLAETTGVRSRAVLLPSCGELGQVDASGLVLDAAALREALNDVDAGGAVVVGHSYGGTVIAEAGDHPAIRSLLYLTSYLPDVGESQGGIMAEEPYPVRITANEDGTLALEGYDADSFGARFLQDSDPAVQREGWDRVTAQVVSAFTTPTTAAGWRGVDSTYLVCTADRSTSVELQRFHAARATRTADLPTGHHPMVERPDLVVERLLPLLGG